MDTDCATRRWHRWRAALAGSAAVSLALVVVFSVLDNAVTATVMAIAVVMIALIALFGRGPGRACEEQPERRRDGIDPARDSARSPRS